MYAVVSSKGFLPQHKSPFPKGINERIPPISDGMYKNPPDEKVISGGTLSIVRENQTLGI